MAKKEFDIAGYKKVMAKYLGDPGGKARVFFDALDCWADDSEEIFDPKAFISSESAESTP